MRSWVPDVAAKGGGEKKEREGRKRGPDEGTAMAAEWNPISDTAKGCLPSQEQSHKTEKGDWARWEDVEPALCCFWTLTVNAPGCLVSHQPWKWLPYGKIGSFKNEEGKWKYKRQSRLSWSGLLPLILLCIFEWIITTWLCERGGTTHTLPWAHKVTLYRVIKC